MKIVRAQTKKQASFLEEQLKDSYAQLFKTAFLYVKNEADALDIVQESIVKILNKISTLKQPEYFTTWAVRIVIWTAIDYLRSNQRIIPVEDFPETSSLQPLSAEDHLDIHTAIQLLPQHLQEITILHYFYGKKLKEISDVFNEPLGTVKYKLREARLLLKDYLEEEENNEIE